MLLTYLLYFLIAAVCCIVFAFYVRRFFRRGPLFTEKELLDLRSRFRDLEKRVYWDPRHAVMEGDKLLDLLLQKRGYRGSMADKLKRAGRQFSNIQDLWYAHKMRNRIVHELDVKIEPKQAKRFLASYKKAFRLSGVDPE